MIPLPFDQLPPTAQMIPPFEALPLGVQIVMVISSILTLAIGGMVVRRMVRAVLGKPLYRNRDRHSK